MKTLLSGLILSSALALTGCSDSASSAQTDASQKPAQPAPAPQTMQTTRTTLAPRTISPELADRFSALALTCMHQEFPNKVSRTTNTAEEMGRPKDIFPVFYGCFDWHSSVHGHWLLVRLLRVGPKDAPWRDAAIAKLNQSFMAENIAGEIANFARPARGSWERPYGLAWYLQLMTELRQWDDPQGNVWLADLEPLETDIADSLKEWLPKLAYPIRLGTHNQSAFAFGLMYDWAEETGDMDMKTLVAQRSMAFHESDVNCPLAYEPSGEDFLSPCLMEADLMRRILAPEDFPVWLTGFLPSIPTDGSGEWLEPGIVKDASDGKLVHLDGVNLSRAWALRGIASALQADDARIPALLAAADIHEETGVAAVSDEHYSGSHWLASFATYLMTDRGIEQ